MLTIVAAAVAAGILGALGPLILRRLPEPAEPDEDKRPYAELARVPGLGLWLGLLAAVLAGLLATRIEPDALIPVWVVMCGVGVLLAFIDWHTRLLPFLIVLPFNAVILVLVAVAAAVESDWSILTRAVISGVVVFVIFFLANAFTPSGLGYGDVRLSFGLAVALGAIGGSEVIVGLWLGFALGAICTLVLGRLKIVDTKGFAFGPYLILGTLIGAAFGAGIFSTVV